MQYSLFDTEHRVLARKYRPKSLDQLVGQEILVKTLSNAIKTNRIPQAVVLTGIRGVGKTTTARIIARMLNCQDLELHGEIPMPCEKCHHCNTISKAQNPDVLEMDAASYTGVNDIRTIIENTNYAPISSNYKIYIIDEAHMLSNSAFNALLKTLEEPPQYLLFILATTEIAKIPLTVLSRCQRFDLRRITIESLKNHYLNILQKENITIDAEALNLIAKTSDGSIRDGLSILDQAISISGNKISYEIISEMLCITNKSQMILLFQHIISGQINLLLELANKLYAANSSPITMINQLLELIHEITKYKITKDQSLYTFNQEFLFVINKIDIIVLLRIWQILSKGIEEVKNSLLPFEAFEMLMIKICYMNSEITPEELLIRFDNNEKTNIPELTNARINEAKILQSSTEIINTPKQLLDLLYEKNELDLYYILHNEVAISELKQGLIKIDLLNFIDNNFINKLKIKLKSITNIDWEINIVSDNSKSLGTQNIAMQNQKIDEIKNQDLVKGIFESFTGAKIVDIKLKE